MQVGLSYRTVNIWPWVICMCKTQERLSAEPATSSSCSRNDHPRGGLNLDTRFSQMPLMPNLLSPNLFLASENILKPCREKLDTFDLIYTVYRVLAKFIAFENQNKVLSFCNGSQNLGIEYFTNLAVLLLQ